MSRKFRIGGSSKSLKNWWKDKKAEEAAKSASSRENGWKDVTTQSDDAYKDVKFKINAVGEMAPITATNPVGDDDIVFGGSKSSLRRIADLERNVSVLATKLTTTDGEATDTNDEDFDTVINKDTKFKRDVQLGNGTSDIIDINGSLRIDGPLTLGSTAKEVIQDIAIQPMLTGNTESGITVIYDDSSNEIDFVVQHAPQWTTARTISLAGDASGSVSINGTANKTLTVSVVNDSHTHDTRYYTKAQVNAAIDADINAVVNAAPATLNTLNELAAALGDDANFASSVNSSIAQKVAKTSSQALRATDALTVSNDTITIHKGDGTSEAVSISDANTWRGISDTAGNDSNNSISRKWAMGAFVGATVSNDTITFTKGDGTTTAVTTSDANSNTYLTGAAFNTSNGVLTLSRNSGSVTVDLDGRFTDNGYADTMNQHVRTTDSPSFANVTATAFNGTATYAKYADLAERYAADAEYAEGTVMAFGGDAEVTAAAGYGSGKLAGVVSHKPAVAMNSEAGNDQTHPYIALQGRVPVRVEGDVKKGDILVASDIAGLAAVWMNADADPRMTAYVGIAISDSADGMVEVKVGK